MFLIPPSSYEIRTLKKKGRGVFAARDIEPGTVIGDYTGTIMHPDKENEKRDGLYSMGAGDNYDVLANPKIKGVHFMNHSCANNCDVYPYQGHLLFFALRKIFKGEELSINYWLSPGDDEDITCDQHACYCGSKICKGTMHDPAMHVDQWEKLVKKEFGKWYKKVPGKYGQQLKPLESYPEFIHPENQKIYHYDIFGSEAKPAAVYHDKQIPTVAEMQKRIRETGRQLSFPNLHLDIFGMQNATLFAERQK